MDVITITKRADTTATDIIIQFLRDTNIYKQTILLWANIMHFVYLIITKNKNRSISYVGYTNNINNRLKLHNNSRGAKFTRGRKWKLAYFKKYDSKSLAMKEEHKLKKNYKLRSIIKKGFMK